MQVITLPLPKRKSNYIIACSLCAFSVFIDFPPPVLLCKKAFAVCK